MRQTALLALLLSTALLAQAGDKKDRSGTVQAPPPKWMKIPRAPVLPPNEALKSFTLDPKYRIELVVAEPLVHDPVAMVFDADARIWVVEMRGLMPNVDGTGEDAPCGTIAILEDTDHDGRMDKRTVFLDKLVLPRAIALVDDGALILTPPELIFCRDTNGDGKADTRELVGKGYGAGLANPEHAINGPIHNLDNWIYFCNHGQRLRRKGGAWQWQPIVRGGQWGLCQDDEGRMFFNTNSNHLIAHLVPPSYAKRNPNLRRMAGTNVTVSRDQAVWSGRVNPGVNRGYRKGTLRADGRLSRFTSTCGPVIYRGALMPELLGNAFAPEPAANLIRRDVLTESGTHVSGANAYEHKEFLTSTDERFRPVNMYNGPDGALYVIDLYRGILQHRVFMTTYLRRQVIERKLDKFIGLGRIYRIVPVDLPAKRIVDPIKLASAKQSELVAALSSKHGQVRSTAQRLLVERADEKTAPALNKLLIDKEASPQTRLHALWTLEGLGKLEQATLEQLAVDNTVEVLQAQAARLCDLNTAGKKLLPLLRDGSPKFTLFVTLNAGTLNATAEARSLRSEIFLSVLTHKAEDPYLRDAAISGLHKAELQFIRTVLASPNWSKKKPGYHEMLRELAACVFRARKELAMVELLNIIATEKQAWRQKSLLDGIVGTLPKKNAKKLRLETRPPALDALSALGDAKLTGHINKLKAALSFKTDAQQSTVRPLTTREQARFATGKDVYTMLCLACHQQNGEGLTGLAPPLRQSEWVLGSEQRLARILLQGMTGPVKVAGKTYNMPLMPGRGAIDDDAKIAAVLTYIRRNWDHQAEPVTAASIAKARATTKGRATPWTEAELLRIK